MAIFSKSRSGVYFFTSTRINKCVKSDVRFLIFGDNFLLFDGRKSIFLSASRSQFVAIGTAKILKICQLITFLWPK